MNLDTTTRSLELLLASAITTNQLNATAHWVDITSTSQTGGSTTINSNNTTAVTITAAPASSTQRRISGVSVFNADTVAATVTIRINDNGTFYNLISVSLAVGSTLSYTDTDGWNVFTSSGPLASGIASSNDFVAIAFGLWG